MAGGKETPRQKMINLMYLVLTAMLALNVSNVILKGYLSINDSIEASKKSMAENNARLTEAFTEMTAHNKKAGAYLKEATDAQKEIGAAFRYIDDVKGNMVRYVLGLPEQTKVLGDTINLRNKPQYDKIDDYDKPTTVLLGSDDMHPLESPLSARDLKKQLETLHGTLIAQLDRMQSRSETKLPEQDLKNLKKKIGIILPKASGFVEDGVKFTWEMDQVDHLPMAAVFVNLNKMQADLRNVEGEILQVFSAASGKLEMKFDRYKACIIPRSNYVESGSHYEASVFIGASSTSIAPGDMEIHLGIDSMQAVQGMQGTKIGIEKGEGVVRIPATNVGDNLCSGVIRYREPNGEFRILPFKNEYKVAKQAATVSADQMNLFYAGLENPVTAAAAGISAMDVDLSCTGAGVSKKKTGPGKYMLTFSGTGECTVTVNGKGSDGQMRPQGPPQRFRVMALPKPQLKLGDKYAPLEMKRGDLALVRSLGAGAPNFMFQVNFVVKDWEISGTDNTDRYYPILSGTGPGLTNEALKLLTRPKVGPRIYFTARILGPDGKITQVTEGVKVTR